MTLRYKLTPEEVIEIYKSKLTYKQMSEWYGVSYSTIVDVRLGRTWPALYARHVEKDSEL